MSTWFANARRRLEKENKMTRFSFVVLSVLYNKKTHRSPRNRTSDDDNEYDYDEDYSTPNSTGNATNESIDRPSKPFSSASICSVIDRMTKNGYYLS